ncbi:MAG: PspC domain-containing protein [Bacteroidota bacterium]
MARERYSRRRSVAEEFDTSLMYDDIEKIRELEEEEEKDQNAKLGSAGAMALIAGGGLLSLGLLSGMGVALGDLGQFMQVALTIIGFGSLGYGFFKTLSLAFRQKELNFPALNVYRKTRPVTGSAKSTSSTNNTRSRPTQERTQESRSRQTENPYERARQRGSYRQEQARTYRRNTTAAGGRKALRRSRTNRVFSGVAGGIAEYAGISPALVRFAFIASFFMPFLVAMPVFVYLLLSIVIPNNYDDFKAGKTGGNAKPGADDDARFRSI